MATKGKDALTLATANAKRLDAIDKKLTALVKQVEGVDKKQLGSIDAKITSVQAELATAVKALKADDISSQKRITDLHNAQDKRFTALHNTEVKRTTDLHNEQTKEINGIIQWVDRELAKKK